MRRVVGLDLSLTSTGVADVNGDTLRWRPRKLRACDRLEWLQFELLDLLRDQRPELASIEGYAYGAKGRAIFDIGELGGVIRLTLHHAGVPYVVIPPSTLKQFATGKGNAGKPAVLAAAEKAAHRPFESHDEADAWWLRAMALQLVRAPLIAPRLVGVLPSKVAWSDPLVGST